MDEGPKETIVLATIKAGIKSFDKISKVANVPSKELEQVLEKLESRNLIVVNEKKGFLGIKIEINITEKGEKNLENQIQELKEKWRQMVQLYKLEDKPKLQQCIDENKIFFKSLIFFGMLDKEIFSRMFKLVDLTMTDYISSKDMPQDIDSE
ncbi:MAG: winged helix-turn-helix transcriptional regulator [Nitrosopumilus sp.]|nr:winged helix-turn-helix transcriptional regulator [Nitrosopumilus sp.]MDH3384634.1 winged helix-turn-helix transcriptional regulator [Nitrosopumilus sp.]